MSAMVQIRRVMQADPLRWHMLGLVRALHLPDCWIGAGFVRAAVWDRLHGRLPSPPGGDVDVIWHDPRRQDPAEDERHEAALKAAEPSILWSVKNQARMHTRNGDAPYVSATEAMRYWPETATAIAVRRSDADHCEIAAPFGADDLVNLVLRPTPCFVRGRRHLYEERVRNKRWAASWPLLRQA